MHDVTTNLFRNSGLKHTRAWYP